VLSEAEIDEVVQRYLLEMIFLALGLMEQGFGG
jgi:hypothetical protein